MDWQLVASYFTVKSTDIFCSVDWADAQAELNLRWMHMSLFVFINTDTSVSKAQSL